MLNCPAFAKRLDRGGDASIPEELMVSSKGMVAMSGKTMVVSDRSGSDDAKTVCYCNFQSQLFCHKAVSLP